MEIKYIILIFYAFITIGGFIMFFLSIDNIPDPESKTNSNRPIITNIPMFIIGFIICLIGVVLLSTWYNKTLLKVLPISQ